ncbi:MAG: hypothetical protein DHS20C16_12710 [Phycisphaerae bacterium]|nr:MAG: hypothetical protein DHS20C16_12710 [Phycisphaerae bacterium]
MIQPCKRTAVATLAGLAAILTASSVNADIQTQVIPLSHVEGDGFPTFSFDLFDTMGGTRTLTGVNLTLDATSTLEVFTENLGSQPINNWDFDFAVLPLFEILGVKKASFPFEGAPYPTVTLNLDAADGVQGSGPDYAHIPERSISLDDSVDVNTFEIFNFEGVGTVDAFVGLPFLIPFPPGPTDTSWIRSETGTLTITYDYVPEPSAIALLGGGAALALRRRRSNGQA